MATSGVNGVHHANGSGSTRQPTGGSCSDRVDNPGRVALITGGAGFIGSHLADRLLAAGWRVRALDNLCEQVHGKNADRPDYLDPGVELIRGDIRDRDAVARALDGVGTVFHLAAAVGVGQSMYEIDHYTSVNAGGTGVLLEALRDRGERGDPVDRLVVASSMSVYGEGLYEKAEGATIEDAVRDERAARSGRWECTADGQPLQPLPTPERKRTSLASVYALSKYEQEQKCLIFGRAYDVPTVALRFFNAYGPRQALSNPYTGVIAIFASRLLNGNPPVIFEDGRQRRDFVSVYDVAEACRLAATVDDADGRVFNIGSGRSVTVREIADAVANALGVEIEPEVSGEYRAGDIRHCFADISLARDVLGYEPARSLEEGIRDLAGWLREQTATDRVDEMRREMRRRGVTTRAAGNGETRPPANGTPKNGNGSAPHAPQPRSNGAANARRGAEPRVLVTGGCGFLGANAVARLAGKGEAVRVLDNFARPGSRDNARMLRDRFGPLVEIVEADVTDVRAVHQAVGGVDRVLHLAAQVAVTTSLRDPSADFETNARGTLNVLEGLRTRRPDAHLIFASTNKVYGDLGGVELRREHRRYRPADDAIHARGVGERPLDFHSPYGCSKGAADQYVLDYARSFGLAATVCRMSCIYGTLQRGTEDQGWVAHFLRRAIRDEPITIYGDGRQVRDLLYVSDLVDAYEAIWARRGSTSGRPFNVGGGPAQAASLLDLLERIEDLVGSPVETRFEPWRTGDQRYYVSDTRRLTEATGWSPRVGLDDGLDRLHTWLGELEDRPDAARSPDRSTRRGTLIARGTA